MTFTAVLPRILGILAIFTLAAALSSARAQPESEQKSSLSDYADLVINDPDVHYGTLDNGLTYYVRSNDKPAGTAELRLVIKAGSVLEDEDQLGLAHLLEHMLFNGTEKYPANELIDFLESLGMEFGPDLNAYTSFDETVYRLSVPTEDEDIFTRGLDVLKEWAFHATLDEEEFEKERAVVYEEWRGRRGASARISDQIYPILLKGSRHTERLPIGDMDVVLNASLSDLKRFYRDWYRPDLMAVIAVGDFDADETVKKIQNLFGRQPATPNPRPRPAYPIARHKETLIKVIHDDEETETNVNLHVKHDPIPTINRIGLKEYLIKELFYTMLQQRLDEVSRSEAPPYLRSWAYSYPFTVDTSLSSMGATVNEDGVKEGFKGLLMEVERVRKYGFLPPELERAKTNMFSMTENYWKRRNDLESTILVSNYIEAFTYGDPYPSIDWYWKSVQDFLPLIALEEVGAMARVLLSSSNRVVYVTGPSVEAVTSIQEEDLRQILQDVESMELAAWTEEAISGSLVENPPESGSIISRGTIPGAGIVTLTLSNNARVLYKVTDFVQDEILFESISAGGSSLVEDDLYISSQFATDAVEEGGLGNHSPTELHRILTGKGVSLKVNLYREFEGMNGYSTEEDLESLFQLIYLAHTSPRLDEVAWNNLKSRVADSIRNRELSPRVLYYDELWTTLYNNHFRTKPLSLEDLSDADLNEALSIYNERFNAGGDFTYIFVGDFEPEILESYIVNWLADLPVQETPESWKDRNVRLYTGSGKKTLEAGTEPLSIVNQSWSGAWNGDFSEWYRMNSLATALEMHLTRIIREEYGGTYSIGVTLNARIIPAKQYNYMITYSCDPERVDELSASVKEIIADWQIRPPESKLAEDVAAMQRRNYKEDLESNSWWMRQIDFGVRSGVDPQELIRDRTEFFNSLTSEVLMETAAKYFCDEIYFHFTLYPVDEEQGGDR